MFKHDRPFEAPIEPFVANRSSKGCNELREIPGLDMVLGLKRVWERSILF
jgi:hypothetical protein